MPPPCCVRASLRMLKTMARASSMEISPLTRHVSFLTCFHWPRRRDFFNTCLLPNFRLILCHSFAVCADTLSHAGESDMRENVSFARRDGKRHRTGSKSLPARGIPSPSRLCIIAQRTGTDPPGASASFAFSLASTSALVPFISVIVIAHRGLCQAAALLVLRITSQSCRARVDMCARRPRIRTSSVSSNGPKYFALT